MAVCKPKFWLSYHNSLSGNPFSGLKVSLCVALEKCLGLPISAPPVKPVGNSTAFEHVSPFVAL